VFLEPIDNVSSMTTVVTILAPRKEVVKCGELLFVGEIPLLVQYLTSRGWWFSTVLTSDQSTESSHIDEANGTAWQGFSA